ncbi:hypothetical protein [Sorangium sp. So ce854]|uniref:hypothetical protein n=1 Tax=Sorangium sp. So ce854 TaxID=3133322 RepID=UPI003F5F7103
MMLKINERFQALHTHDTQVDWVAIQAVERDICLLYHQLADYSHIMGDLYYGDVFGLPYWEYLDVQGLTPEQRDFIRVGCLVLLFAMASDVLDGSGAYLTMDPSRYAAASAAVRSLTGLSDDVDRLAGAVRHAFAMIDAGAGTWDQPAAAMDVNDLSTWIHERFVRRYFEDRAREFSTNPYYRGQGPDAGG